ncbi:MAG: alpha/beta fold hydrolase [Fervidobacterium gondwanense]
MDKEDYLKEFEPFVYKDYELRLPYRLYIPRAYRRGNVENQNFPLVVFLHGAGERGTDNIKQITANEGATVWASDEVQVKHPCFVLAPQCPEDSYWGTSFRIVGSSEYLEPNALLATVNVIIEKLIDKYPIDTSKIYITGLSMGGFGSVALMTMCPDRFAAGVVVCGGGNVRKAYKIAKIPIWFFHAEDDDVVPVHYTRDLVRELEKLGAPVKYTEYPKGYMGSLGLPPHASWVPTYRNKEMIEWLFEQRKK